MMTAFRIHHSSPCVIPLPRTSSRDEYGDQFVCLRYRYDHEPRRKYKTSELVVEESDWNPVSLPVSGSISEDLVGVEAKIEEFVLRTKVKHAIGRWDPQSRLWRLTRRSAELLGLSDRIRQ